MKFAIIQTRSLKTTDEEFVETFEQVKSRFEMKGFFKKTKLKNQTEFNRVMETFRKECLVGLKSWSPATKKKVSEDYDDRDLCSQVWDLQKDLKCKTEQYYCSHLMDLGRFREFISMLDPLVESIKPLHRLEFELQFKRNVEEVV